MDLIMGASASLKYANGSLPAGNTVTGASEVAWASTYTIPAGMLRPRTSFSVVQYGVYQAGLAQSITPRVRLGPSATALTSRTVIATTASAVSGLLNAASDTPWAADIRFVVMDDNTIMSAGRLFFSTSATASLTALVASKTTITGVDFTVDNVLTGSSQWAASNAGNTITCTEFVVRVESF